MPNGPAERAYGVCKPSCHSLVACLTGTKVGHRATARPGQQESHAPLCRHGLRVRGHRRPRSLQNRRQQGAAASLPEATATNLRVHRKSVTSCLPMASPPPGPARLCPATPSGGGEGRGADGGPGPPGATRWSRTGARSTFYGDPLVAQLVRDEYAHKRYAAEGELLHSRMYLRYMWISRT